MQPPDDPDNAANDLDNNPRYIVLPDFRSRFLPDPRDIFLYLPEAYLTEPHRHFPVFYLHDGQNLFDPRRSYIPGHTWRANSTTDDLTGAGLIEPIILVGVANTGIQRMPEYTPDHDPRLGGGEGPLYAKLLIDDLKPKIDADYRTLPDASNTALGGSSLGGLISLAIGLQHPDIFGKLAVISPSVWWNDRSILRLVSNTNPRPHLRIWLDMGMAEGLNHLRDTDLLHSRLLTRGWHDSVDLTYLRVPNAQHNEDAWADRFGQALQFLFPPAK
jgi:predicted alpha/beta superfamily hydrolase